ncbi:hypothetical protein ABK040_010796 [Willaertia magna]
MSGTPNSDPTSFLKNEIIGKPVTIKLNSGVEYRGILTCLDGYMNAVLEQTKEFVDGAQTGYFGDAFIRGNNAKASFPINQKTLLSLIYFLFNQLLSSSSIRSVG